MKTDLSARFGFLVRETATLYGQQFDRRAREELGLSQAQVRLLWKLSHHPVEPPSQAELAQSLGITPMAVATMCDRLAAAGWVERRPHASDRRVNQLHILPKATEALAHAVRIGDELTAAVLRDLSAAERKQLVALLARAREGLLAADAKEATP